jgi:hypothetical protein
MSTTFTQKFNLDTSLFDQIAENIDNLQSTARTQMLSIGKKVNFKGSINGIEVPASVTLREASLSRISVLRQQSPYTGKEYYLVTGVMNPVKMDLNVTVDGAEISIVDLLHKFVTESGKTVDRDKFIGSTSLMACRCSSTNSVQTKTASSTPSTPSSLLVQSM